MVSLIKDFFRSIDNNCWKKVGEIFADKVLIDYESFGGTEEVLPKEVIIKRWITFLPGFDKTSHNLSNFIANKDIITVDAEIFHYINDKIWIVEGSYEIKVVNNKILELKFSFIKSRGENLTNEAIIKSTPHMEKVFFFSHGQTIVGNLYYPPKYKEDKKYIGIIVTGSWTTVKEQMAHNYALDFAKYGFVVLTYDPRGYGESSGEPKFYENPSKKIEDLRASISFLETLPMIKKISAFGICAGAAYTLVAASEDSRLSSIACAATWIHDNDAVKMFYGGEEGVEARIHDSQVAEEKFKSQVIVDYVPTYSQTDENAAMYDPDNLYDYYNNPKRGRIKEWSHDKFALMSWEKWLRFNPRKSAKTLDKPTLMIHSDGAVLPDYVKIYFDEIKTPDKNLIWLDVPSDIIGMHQFYFYDQENEVSIASYNAYLWFDKY